MTRTIQLRPDGMARVYARGLSVERGDGTWTQTPGPGDPWFIRYVYLDGLGIIDRCAGPRGCEALSVVVWS